MTIADLISKELNSKLEGLKRQLTIQEIISEELFTEDKEIIEYRSPRELARLEIAEIWEY